MYELSYEQAVHWLRTQPEYSELVKLAYLDEDNLAAAQRFAASEEFFEVAKLLSLREGKQNLKILDLGCGNGIASYAFASLGHDVTAVDPDPSIDVGLEATKRLSEKIQNGSITVIQAFAECLPFSDAVFDVVYARQALHHFSDLNSGIAECFRVLKPGGTFFATREHVVDDEKQLQEFLENHILHKWHGGENAYPLDRYILALEAAKFQTLRFFSPFDSVINYYPTSNSDIKSQLFHTLKRRLGKFLALAFIKIPGITALYQKYLSYRYNAPGRLFSFLCQK
jgi:ubiquinone/menaquinone biosynthesis C-methylase UbiE